MLVQIHAGADKTGSTTIQACLWQHRDLLARSGFLCPAFPEPVHVPGHWQLATFWQDQLDTGDERLLATRIAKHAGDLFGETRAILLATLEGAARHPGGVVLLSA